MRQTTSKPPDPPSDLSARSRALWTEVVFPGCGGGRLAVIEFASQSLDTADQAAAILARHEIERLATLAQQHAESET